MLNSEHVGLISRTYGVSRCGFQQIVSCPQKIVPETAKYLPNRPQCAGKTTLLKALQSYYAVEAHREFENHRGRAPAIIEEAVRTFIFGYDFNIQDLKNADRGFELQYCILLEQVLYGRDTSR